VDTPVVFLHEFHTLEVIDPQGTAGFALGVFALLIVLSAITMRQRLVWSVLGLAAMMEVTLMYLAAMEPGAMVGGVVILFLLAISVVLLIKRVTDLVAVATEENARVDSLSRFLAPVVMKEINAADSRALRGGERLITVLFADIRGFTTLSEHLAPEEVVALLNDYFTRMTTVIFRHGGTLDKFVGDGLMAYFGAPVAQDDQADRAVRCAIEMQQALNFLNVERGGRGEPAIHIGIGMHTGSAMVGIIGSDKRKEYTAVGDTVNVAARVEGLTKEYGRPLLVSAATLDLAKDTYEVDRVGDIEIRGRVKSLEMFAIQESEFEGERQTSKNKAQKKGKGAQMIKRATAG
jgi:adenylate cyclase